MICGDAGYAKFKSRRNKRIKPGQDGSYVVVNRQGDQTVIGTDFGGYSTLFLYQSGSNWAVSNSFLTLAQHAHGGSGNLTADLLSLQGHGIECSLGFQTLLLSMGVKEIQLIPAGQQIVIQHHPTNNTAPVTAPLSVTVEPIWTRKRTFEDRDRYQAAMRTYLTTAAGRICTMLQSDADITCDITGGRDSRTVLSLMLFASRLLGISLNERVHFNSRETAGIDFEISKDICTGLGIDLNRGAEDILGKRSIHGAHGYHAWKQQHLGAYHQIMFPIVYRDSTHLWLSGHGGESNRYRRSFGSSPDVETYFKRSTKRIGCKTTQEQLLQRFLADLERQRQSAYSDSDDFTLLYRSYRDRMHHGRRSRMFNAVTPLSSKLLRAASDHCGPEEWEKGLVLADIIANMAPDLLRTRFEKTYPGFDTGTLIIRKLLPRFTSEVDTTGELFRSPSLSPIPTENAPRDPIGIIKDDFDKALPKVKDLGVYSDAFLDTAQQAMDQAEKDLRFRSRPFGSQVSNVLLGAELSQLWR